MHARTYGPLQASQSASKMSGRSINKYFLLYLWLQRGGVQSTCVARIAGVTSLIAATTLLNSQKSTAFRSKYFTPKWKECEFSSVELNLDFSELKCVIFFKIANGRNLHLILAVILHTIFFFWQMWTSENELSMNASNKATYQSISKYLLFCIKQKKKIRAIVNGRLTELATASWGVA